MSSTPAKLAATKRYQKANPEKVKAWKRAAYHRRKNTPEYKAKTRAYYLANQERIKERSRLHGRANAERKNAVAKAWYQEHKEYRLEYKRKHSAIHREEINAWKRDWNTRKGNKKRYMAEKMKDPLFRLQRRLRQRVGVAFKYRSLKKTRKVSDLLGADFETVMRHIESKFKPGMSWENYGRNGWHVDHIVPCSAFDLSNPEEQRQCFHFTNLQPLWAAENMSKADKMPEQAELPSFGELLKTA